MSDPPASDLPPLPEQRTLGWDGGDFEIRGYDAQDMCEYARAALARSAQAAVPAKLSDETVNAACEAAYWQFDARRKGYAEWQGTPQAERDAFKAEARRLIAGRFPINETEAQATKREMLAVADAFIRGRAAVPASQPAQDDEARELVETLRSWKGDVSDRAADLIERLTAERDACKNALGFAAGAIGDAIYTEDGLDGDTGQRVLHIITEARERGTFDQTRYDADVARLREDAGRWQYGRQYGFPLMQTRILTSAPDSYRCNIGDSMVAAYGPTPDAAVDAAIRAMKGGK